MSPPKNKPKKRKNNTLNGATPPDISESKNNLEQPEHGTLKDDVKPVGRPKSNRTKRLATTITPEFDEALRLEAF